MSGPIYTSSPPPQPFNGHTHGTWKFLGQGSNPSHSCHLHHSCGNAESLNHCARPGNKSATLQSESFFFFFYDDFFSIIFGLQCSFSFLLYSKVTQSHTHTCIHMFFFSHPPSCSITSDYSSQCHTAGSHCLSIAKAIVCIY